ncbi:translation initiation factor IF-2 subunit beta [Candidatus Marsarchaeota G2 archaeon ECH_B_SAG-E12]|uniref:Translation initiation factor 2 subunit beta n=1 Tax=Candidatus Marsarchaeota G2 archaeon ECH_B_SAG-E12 TaxID=1978164 RepID=A0A2R6BVU8_9ARCH|nr:MAG: translation initiation factor IF-2 subunit beta [Candidatus Marsarchaeota G2 archaeon ECH_B_SAG-E12]
MNLNQDEIYMKLLNKLYEQLPSISGSGEWFSVPEPHIRYEGDKSYFLNFKETYELFRRDPNHLMKFLVKHLATAGYIDNDGRLVLQGRFSEEQIKQLLERYVSIFVKCPTCGRPDTKLVKKLKVVYMVCEACGAETPLRIVQ